MRTGVSSSNTHTPLVPHQTLQREIEGHQPRVAEVLERGRRMEVAARAEGRPEAERIVDQVKELEQAWEGLQDEMDKRRERLNGSNLAQQYYNDADEAEAWIGEQELYMIADEKAKVRRNYERKYIHLSKTLLKMTRCNITNKFNTSFTRGCTDQGK